MLNKEVNLDDKNVTDVLLKTKYIKPDDTRQTLNISKINRAPISRSIFFEKKTIII